MIILLPQIMELAGVHGHGAFPTGEIVWRGLMRFTKEMRHQLGTCYSD